MAWVDEGESVSAHEGLQPRNRIEGQSAHRALAGTGRGGRRWLGWGGMRGVTEEGEPCRAWAGMLGVRIGMARQVGTCM